MKKIKAFTLTIWLLIFLAGTLKLCAQTSDDLSKQISQLPDIVSVKKIDNHPFFKETYEIGVDQYLDHKNHAAGKFTQRVILSHFNPFSPVIMVTEGYHANYATEPKHINELSRIIEANQLVVEHRYFGKSVPENQNWNYLTVENSAGDLHHILTIFKKIYPNNKWIATGISKGGQTTLAYKTFYPHDVNIWIPYVAPVNYGVEDSRHGKFLQNVGDKSTRDKIRNFQLAVLQNRSLIEPLLDSVITADHLKFRLPSSQILDYCVLEYPFSFWQWGEYPHRIPEWNNNPRDLFSHLMEVSPPDYFDINKMNPIRPFFIQAAKELGYYGYDTKALKPFLTIENSKGYLKKLFLEEDEIFKFNKTTSALIEKTVNSDGGHILLIYGEYDPWSASSLKVSSASKAKKLVIPKSDHKVRIENLTYEQKAKVYMILETWLDE